MAERTRSRWRRTGAGRTTLTAGASHIMEARGTLSMPWNDFGFALGADVERTWPRTSCGCGCGLDAVTDLTRTIHGHSLDADRFAGNSRPLRGHQHGYTMDFSGRCRAVAWTLRGLRRQLPSHLRTIAPTWRGIHRSLVRRFPQTARTRQGSCSAIARMIHRMLRGRCWFSSLIF